MQVCRMCRTQHSNLMIACLCDPICEDCLNKKRFNPTNLKCLVSCDYCYENYRMVKRPIWSNYYYAIAHDILAIIFIIIFLIITTAYGIGAIDKESIYTECGPLGFVCVDKNRPILRSFVDEPKLDSNLNYVYVIISIISLFIFSGIFCACYDCVENCIDIRSRIYRDVNGNLKRQVVCGCDCITMTEDDAGYFCSRVHSREQNYRCSVVFMIISFLLCWTIVGIIQCIFYSFIYFGKRFYYHRRNLLIKTAIESYPVLDTQECVEKGDYHYSDVANEVLEVFGVQVN